MDKVFKFENGYFKTLENGRFTTDAKLEDAQHAVRPMQERLIRELLDRHNCVYKVIELNN